MKPKIFTRWLFTGSLLTSATGTSFLSSPDHFFVSCTHPGSEACLSRWEGNVCMRTVCSFPKSSLGRKSVGY